MRRELEPIWIEWPFTRIRRSITVENGQVLRFVMQLEYDVNAEYSDLTQSRWTPIARFDHDSSDNETNHDIEEEGLHLDIYKNGEKMWTSANFPDIPLNRAPRYCEEYLEENADRLIERFERWYDKPLQRVA